MFARFRKKLPGPKATAFWATAATAVTVYRYNKRESTELLDHYCRRASHAAQEPMGALDTPHKVHVYIAVPMGELGTRKARQHWEKYILPVFVAGALDYELTLVNETESDGGIERVVRGGVHRMVSEEIKDRRRRQLEAAGDNTELQLWRAAIEERERENERRRLRNRLGAEPGMSVLELWKAKPYAGVMDIVAIGRESWVEVVNGVSEGAVGSLNVEVPPLVQLDSEKVDPIQTPSGSTTEKSDETDTASQITDPNHAAHTINYDRYDDDEQQKMSVALPAVAYIKHGNLSGWGTVPRRIYNFFHDQQNVDEYARQALQVVYESTRRAARGRAELEAMGREEEGLPGWQGQEPLDVVVDSRVADRMQIYDTQNDTAPVFED